MRGGPSGWEGGGVSWECKPEGRAEILNVLEEWGTRKSQERWREPGTVAIDMFEVDLETYPVCFPWNCL